MIFQGMDAAGNDGAIRHVMSGVNPQGCQVFSFKHPSAGELHYDFLWLTTCDLPERGRIGIFNRSYYEEVLIARVHPELLINEGKRSSTRKRWRHRHHSITNLERHLHANGTRIVKFFLHLSADEQRRRLLERIDHQDKNWKLNRSDITEWTYWSRYMKAYAECISATSTHHAPWGIVPADDKESTRLIVSQVMLDTFDSLKMRNPKTDTKRLRELQEIRGNLAN